MFELVGHGRWFFSSTSSSMCSQDNHNGCVFKVGSDTYMF